MNFEEVYEEFKEYAIKRHKKQSFNNVCQDFKKHVLPYFKDFNIYDITEKDLLKWKDSIELYHFSNTYNAKIYYAICEYFDYLYLYYNISSNFARDVGSFKKHAEVKKTDYYTLKEFKQFIKGFDNLVYKSFFTFLFYTGCRPSEAMAIKFSDITGHYASINKSIERRGKRNLVSTKNVYSNRVVLLNRQVVKCIKCLFEYYGGNDDYFIFGGSKPLSSSTIDRYKKEACTKVGIRAITQHQFRHSYATYLITSGIALNNVSKLLGHSNISITSKVYVHQDLSQEKRVLRTLNSSHFLF